ncbi:MAG: homoserine O-acetyltransferase MetX [Alkalispirochaetaceae bacterium]
MATSPNGIVEQHDVDLTLPAGGLLLDSGRRFGPITVRYERYGEMNREKSNVILVLHAFSGDAHAAGLHSWEDAHPGWWEEMIGPGRALDTDKYCVICSNVLGGCQGTTGPGSTNPDTGEPYAMSFPIITIRDMTNVQRLLLEHLGIPRLYGVIGGSMGGMNALDWAVAYPEQVERAIVLASTARSGAQSIAFNAVGRNAIMSDPRWKEGLYYGGESPARGLAIARMVGHITYLSDESMGMKFGRRLQERDGFGSTFSDQFAVESYLEYQGDKFVDRFDANSYIYLTKAMDYFDLSERYGSLDDAFARTTARFLILSYSSDWLFPTRQSKEIVYALMKNGKDVSYSEISSPYGHDSFLLETERQEELIVSFLEGAHGG